MRKKDETENQRIEERHLMEDMDVQLLPYLSQLT